MKRCSGRGYGTYSTWSGHVSAIVSADLPFFLNMCRRRENNNINKKYKIKNI